MHNGGARSAELLLLRITTAGRSNPTPKTVNSEALTMGCSGARSADLLLLRFKSAGRPDPPNTVNSEALSVDNV